MRRFQDDSDSDKENFIEITLRFPADENGRPLTPVSGPLVYQLCGVAGEERPSRVDIYDLSVPLFMVARDGTALPLVMREEALLPILRDIDPSGKLIKRFTEAFHDLE